MLWFAIVVLAARPPSAMYNVKELRRKANQAARRSTDGSVVLVSASFDYAPVLVNWLANVERLGVRNWLVVCFDKPMRQFLERRGATSLVLCQTRALPQHQGIWLARLAILRDLIAKGIAVTLSDLDAIWLKDATPYLHVADVVASRGSHPSWASDAWGASLCMGLIRFNPGSEAFVKLFLLREGTGDDQCAVNQALKRVNLTWTTPLPLPYVNSSTTDTGVAANCRGLTVALLPHSTFVRICDLERSRGAVVEHCLTPKTVPSKRDSLRQRGTWIIDANWSHIAPSAGWHYTPPPKESNQTRFYTWLLRLTAETNSASTPATVPDNDVRSTMETSTPPQSHKPASLLSFLVTWLLRIGFHSNR